jgi:hypothetical protein
LPAAGGRTPMVSRKMARTCGTRQRAFQLSCSPSRTRLPICGGRSSLVPVMQPFRGNEADNAEGVESSSPGLRGTSYPGSASRMRPTLKGLKHRVCTTEDSTLSGLVLRGANPKVDAPSSHQPWADRLNAVGVHSEVTHIHNRL